MWGRVVVTGASSGIGTAFAEALAAGGAECHPGPASPGELLGRLGGGAPGLGGLLT